MARQDELTARLQATIANTNPTQDIPRTLALTGSDQTLPNESCKWVTLRNLSGVDITFNLNNGTANTLKNNMGTTLFTDNANKITVNGASGTLQYVISY